MEYINEVSINNDQYNNKSSSLLSPPISSGSSSSSPPSPVVLSPCAACKTLRRRCVEKCVLAPYFPPTDPLKFTTAHRVFGASNIIKLLQELPEDQRADAVNSMVYEANARLRDPVYGCAGAICQLQKQINELQAELAKARAEKLNVQCQNFNLIESMKLHQVSIVHDDDDVALTPEISPFYNQNFFFEEGNNFGIGAAAWDFGAASMDTMGIISII